MSDKKAPEVEASVLRGLLQRLDYEISRNGHCNDNLHTLRCKLQAPEECTDKTNPDTKSDTIVSTLDSCIERLRIQNDEYENNLIHLQKLI